MDEYTEHTDKFFIKLTNEERRYFALSPIDECMDTVTFYSKTNLWHTDAIVYFDQDTIVKVIIGKRRILADGRVNYRSYLEYDTSLKTEGRRLLPPLTSKGRAKKLTLSAITAVDPFGCSLALSRDGDRCSYMKVQNARARKYFPIGEHERIAKITSDAEFHEFAKYYIATCPDGYFERLQDFKDAKKVTVKYKPGDIFRMELDRTHYCYGIITGEIKKLRKLPELPKKHSFLSLMTVPIAVRLYRLITERKDLTACDLADVPLGRMSVCSDNDIIWGRHTIVDSKELTVDDIEFNLICQKIRPEIANFTYAAHDMFIRDGLFFSRDGYGLYVEWGFSQAYVASEDIPDSLRDLLSDYISAHSGVSISIDPQNAIINESYRNYTEHKYDLLNPENRVLKNELFSALGLPADAEFDDFANKFGGPSLATLCEWINGQKKNKKGSDTQA